MQLVLIPDPAGPLMAYHTRADRHPRRTGLPVEFTIRRIRQSPENPVADTARILRHFRIHQIKLLLRIKRLKLRPELQTRVRNHRKTAPLHIRRGKNLLHQLLRLHISLAGNHPLILILHLRLAVLHLPGNHQKRKQNATLIELWVGIVFFALVSLLAGIWFVENEIAYALGVLVGALTAVYLAWHMARSIDKMLDRAEEGADPGVGMRVSSLLRYGIVVLVLIITAFVSEWVNPISTFVGIIGLKVAAYLQPFTHKIVFKVFGWEEEVYPEMPDTEE